VKVKKWLLATTGVLVTASICAGAEAALQFGVPSFAKVLQLPAAMAPAALGMLLIVLAPVWWPKAAALMTRRMPPRSGAPAPETLRVPPSQVSSGAVATRKPALSPVDREFLPAALELVETPTSPITVALIWCICVGFASALAWSYFGHLDIYAVAQGKIQPSGSSKIVQSLEPGRIAAILVENGMRVSAGDTLLELDATEASADRTAQARELEATEAEAARRRIAVVIAHSMNLVPQVIPFTLAINDGVRRREQSVLAAEISQLASARDGLKAQLDERAAQRERLMMSISARTQLVAFLKERVAMRDAIDTQWQGYRGKVIDALQEYERERTNLAGEQGQLIENDAAKLSLERKIDELVSEFVMQQTQKLAETERKRDQLEQQFIKAQSKNERMRLSAPIDGIVQQLAVATVGQVVSSGQPLMTIVPLDAPVEVEALIQNKDIGFVENGQPATVKVDAFPFTRYGTVQGTIMNISRDGVDEKTAANLSDAAGLTRPQAPSTGTPTAQSLVFAARIAILRQSILVDGKEIRLLPGMAVTVDISTGQRRAIDYVLGPLREVQAASWHER
jgi:hemolysin D